MKRVVNCVYYYSYLTGSTLQLGPDGIAIEDVPPGKVH